MGSAEKSVIWDSSCAMSCWHLIGQGGPVHGSGLYRFHALQSWEQWDYSRLQMKGMETRARGSSPAFAFLYMGFYINTTQLLMPAILCIGPKDCKLVKLNTIGIFLIPEMTRYSLVNEEKATMHSTKACKIALGQIYCHVPGDVA